MFPKYGRGDHLGHVTLTIYINFVPNFKGSWSGGVAQWLGCWIWDQGVPGSNPSRCTFRCGLEQVTFTPCLVLVKPRKRWTDD